MRGGGWGEAVGGLSGEEREDAVAEEAAGEELGGGAGVFGGEEGVVSVAAFCALIEVGFALGPEIF